MTATNTAEMIGVNMQRDPRPPKDIGTLPQTTERHNSVRQGSFQQGTRHKIIVNDDKRRREQQLEKAKQNLGNSKRLDLMTNKLKISPK